MKHKIYVLIYDHDWGTRYPRRKSSFYFLNKPSKSAIEEILGLHGLVNDEKYYEVRSLNLAERYMETYYHG